MQLNIYNSNLLITAFPPFFLSLVYLCPHLPISALSLWNVPCMGLSYPLSFLSFQFRPYFLLSKLLDQSPVWQLHLWPPEILKYLPEHSQVNLLNELLCNSLVEPLPWFSIIPYTAGSNTSKMWPQIALSVLCLTMPNLYLSVLSSSYTWEIC